jgi:hypothetical protein
MQQQDRRQFASEEGHNSLSTLPDLLERQPLEQLQSSKEFHAAYLSLRCFVRLRFRKLTHCRCDLSGGACKCLEPRNIDDLTSDVLPKVLRALREKKVSNTVGFVSQFCRNHFFDERDKYHAQKRGAGHVTSISGQECDLGADDRTSIYKIVAVREIVLACKAVVQIGKVSPQIMDLFVRYQVTEDTTLKKLALEAGMSISALHKSFSRIVTVLRNELKDN